ncbi:MAG: Hpt domain-containing protein [Planctomycetota bacterium]|nr:Hpt domain-containing protein [Planctomycetota bacterium]
MSQDSPTPMQPLRSTFLDDPEMAELASIFVAELPDHVRTLESAIAQREWDGLRRASHRLRGAAGGYGFQPISDAAGQLEDKLRELTKPPETDADLALVAARLRELVALCNRATMAS